MFPCKETANVLASKGLDHPTLAFTLRLLTLSLLIFIIRPKYRWDNNSNLAFSILRSPRTSWQGNSKDSKLWTKTFLTNSLTYLCLVTFLCQKPSNQMFSACLLSQCQISSLLRHFLPTNQLTPMSNRSSSRRHRTHRAIRKPGQLPLT